MGSTIIASAMIRQVQERYHEAEHCFCIFRKNAASLRLLGLFREECIFRIRDDSLAQHGDRRLALHDLLPPSASTRSSTSSSSRGSRRC
jgi:hypothetical protein